MKKIIILMFCFFSITSLWAYGGYGSTSIYEIQLSPNIESGTEKDVLSLNGNVLVNFNFGYKENIGVFLQLGLGLNLLQKEKTENSFKFDGNLNYDITLGLSYMAKFKKNNLYGLLGIGANLKKPSGTNAISINEFDIGISIYGDLEYKINDKMFLSLGGKFTHSFIEFGQKYNTVVSYNTSENKYQIYFGVGFETNR